MFFSYRVRSKTIQELLSRGWVPLLLRWLGLVHRPNLQVETLAALTTVAQNTSEHTPLLLKVKKNLWLANTKPGVKIIEGRQHP